MSGIIAQGVISSLAAELGVVSYHRIAEQQLANLGMGLNDAVF
jgi:hypothetical protein